MSAAAMVGGGWLLLAGWAAAVAVRGCRRGAPRSVDGRGRSGAAAGGRPTGLPRLGPDMGRRLAGRGDGDALPEVVEAVAAAVRSGRSLAGGVALAAAGAPPHLARPLAAVAAVAAQGVPVAAALDRWADRSEHAGAGLVATAVGLAGDAGGDADAALAGVAITLRERRALRREIRALSSQARLSATVIALAPLAFAALAVTADGRTAGFLFASPGGLACLAAGFALDLAGWRWMRAITASVDGPVRPPVARWVRRRLRRAGEGGRAVAALPEVVDLLAVAAAAGLPTAAVLAAVAPRAPAPWREALVAALDDAAGGQLLADALGRLVADLGDSAGPLVAVLRDALADGDALLPGLHRLAVDARDLRRRRAEEAARRLPVRLLLPLVACSLPAFAALTIVPILAGTLQGLRLPT